MEDGGAVFGVVASLQGEATSDEGGSGHSRLPVAAVAARPRHLWRQRCLSAVAAVVVRAGMVHVTKMVCRPAAWLTATRGLRPLSIHILI